MKEPIITELDGELEPSLFESPNSPNEAKRRQHIQTFALIASDERETLEARINAVQHILACDPPRGVAILVQMLGTAYSAVEDVLGLPRGEVVDLIGNHVMHATSKVAAANVALRAELLVSNELNPHHHFID